ncbi:MAG: glycosyltransferase family 4 protein [Candidatus Promineifilaceae bacterium]
MQLTLFFTKGLSLQHWQQMGILSREVALYRRLQAAGVQIQFVTYGVSDRDKFSDALDGIEILCNHWGLPQRLYTLLLPLLHHKGLRQTDVIKTNQMQGGEVALRASKLWRKPLIARCGYMWSHFSAEQHTHKSTQHNQALAVEKRLFTQANQIVVPTKEMADDIRARFPNVDDAINIIPNYVDTEKFRPISTLKQYDIVFIGRLEAQKNVDALLSAIRKLNLSALIVGKGSLEKQLKQTFADLNQQITWRENVPHDELPLLLNQGRLFVLPSFYEGHPKTLLEAMACGLPVIGAQTPGIQNVLTHGKTGWLCRPNTTEIAQSIQVLLKDAALQTSLGNAARDEILASCALTRIVELESALLNQIVSSVSAKR